MKNKIKKFIYMYLVYGYLSTCIITNVYSLIYLKKYDLSLDALIGNILASIVVFPVVWGLKEVFKEYIETWKQGSTSARLILFFGLIFVLYGVYYRANR
ncbi:hypothetical protein VSU16_14810 (plasmid) [Cetobacterium somerae]|uniref:hypothetical protein n=1 Tax=Cetobacterium somerae TaxID=188913 RepID=UPI002E7B4F1A|nr:hypothetical protein [Cetobacterium somerae]WVJ02999.1 hypothetical protein VSU16_14810 [Cetobacterium somerae]